VFFHAVLSFSFLQSKEKERTAKKEKEKHAIVFYAFTKVQAFFPFTPLFSPCISPPSASPNRLGSLPSLK